jgi:hypothetical protein
MPGNAIVLGAFYQAGSTSVPGRLSIVARHCRAPVPAFPTTWAPQLGRPPYDDREPGRHGLGLAIIRAIADARGAVLTANPRPGGGLDVLVRFQ